tara:strand:+ start:668 stop:880 length:213 start_codon:yes stop_codon:yes gene_type:complete
MAIDTKKLKQKLKDEILKSVMGGKASPKKRTGPADRHPPKSKKKLPRTKRSMGPAGASTVSKDGKRMKKR